MAPRPLPTREDILRELERRVTVSYEVVRDIERDFRHLLDLLWGAQCPIDPYAMSSADRLRFLQAMPEYNAAIAKLETARIVFQEAAVMRNRFKST
jgi:hypothetical protein